MCPQAPGPTVRSQGCQPTRRWAYLANRLGWQIVAEIKEVDVYDPTTAQIRSASSGESLFVRHAYFTGAEEPYDKLKRALRAEIDEAAWSCLYRTGSRVFPRP